MAKDKLIPGGLGEGVKIGDCLKMGDGLKFKDFDKSWYRVPIAKLVPQIAALLARLPPLKRSEINAALRDAGLPLVVEKLETISSDPEDHTHYEVTIEGHDGEIMTFEADSAVVGKPGPRARFILRHFLESARAANSQRDATRMPLKLTFDGDIPQGDVERFNQILNGLIDNLDSGKPTPKGRADARD